MDRQRISYVNGRYVRHDRAVVHIEDRGYQFADGVYEVIAIANGFLIDENLHFERLKKSLDAILIEISFPVSSIHVIIEELQRRNDINDGYVYVQISRGEAPRNHVFPDEVKPSIVITLNNTVISEQYYTDGVDVITTPDQRWGRCDIKSISLLPNILAKQKAAEVGAKEAWLIKDGVVIEGSSSNSYIVKGNTIYTHPLGKDILGGITRAVVLQMAVDNEIIVKEKAFSMDDIDDSDEAFMTSTTMGVVPIRKVNGKEIGNGKPGQITNSLMKLYKNRLELISKRL